MAWKQNMKYLRKMGQIPKNWKDALRLWRIKQRYPNENVFRNSHNGKYYYNGVLLQMKDDGDDRTFYYKTVIWEIEE